MSTCSTRFLDICASSHGRGAESTGRPRRTRSGQAPRRIQSLPGYRKPALGLPSRHDKSHRIPSAGRRRHRRRRRPQHRSQGRTDGVHCRVRRGARRRVARVLHVRPARLHASMSGQLVNDVHSKLNETLVDAVVPVDSLESIGTALDLARSARRPVAIAGGRHSMGGQQFASGGVVLDTRPLSRVLSLDDERGLVEVEAGIQWPALVDALADTPWAIRQKQTGADDLCIGGAVSSTVHGRGLAYAPFVADIERLVVVGADGVARTCSRDEDPELFRLVCGGYGLFGVVHSATLRLDRGRKVERVVRLAHAAELEYAFADRISDGFLYGDFQFEIDPASPTFLQQGVFSCYRPVPDATPLRPDTKPSADDWR